METFWISLAGFCALVVFFYFFGGILCRFLDRRTPRQIIGAVLAIGIFATFLTYLDHQAGRTSDIETVLLMVGMWAIIPVVCFVIALPKPIDPPPEPPPPEPPPEPPREPTTEEKIEEMLDANRRRNR